MRPFFSLHAGEQLVANYIERHYKRATVWIPSRDTGVDLLVADPRRQHTVGLQVKFSRDWLVTETHKFGPEFQKQLRACGWWTINRHKLRHSQADYWVLVLLGFAARSVDFVIVPPRELWRRLRHRTPTKSKVHVYFWTTEAGRCWETRDVTRAEEHRIASGDYENRNRDFKPWLNNWTPVARLNR